MKNTLRICHIGMMALGAVLVLAACHKTKNTDNEPIAVDVAYPIVDSVTLYKTYPGQVYSTDMADVVGRVNGEILSCSFSGGSRVKKGQVLFTIESSKYRDIVSQAEAALAIAKSKYLYAEKQLAALRRALESNAVSQMDVIQAQSNMEQAAADIKNATAALKTARTNLGYCTVVAPISGTISTPELDVGSYVSGDGSPVKLTSIFDETALAVRFNIEDNEYERLVRNAGGLKNPIYRHVPITFSNPLRNDYFIDMYYESPTVDVSTGTLLMKGSVKNANDELKDGMYCTVKFPYGKTNDAILIKDASIGTDQLGKYVYVVNDSGKVVSTHIEVGDLYRDSLRIVTKGLTPKQKYITKAMLNVRAGEKVKPVLSK